MKPVRMSVVRWRRARVDLKSHPLQFGGKMKMCLSSAPHDSVVFSSSLARASRSAHLLIFLRNWFPVSSNKCGKRRHLKAGNIKRNSSSKKLKDGVMTEDADVPCCHSKTQSHHFPITFYHLHYNELYIF